MGEADFRVLPSQRTFCNIDTKNRHLVVRGLGLSTHNFPDVVGLSVASFPNILLS